jgi:hypothetical protein
MLPQELVDLIIDRAVSEGHSLRRYAMVSHAWNHSVRRHSSRSVRIRGVTEYRNFLKSVKAFPGRIVFCRSVYLHDGGFDGRRWQAGKLGFHPIIQQFTFITELKIDLVDFTSIDKRSLALFMDVEHPPLPNLQKVELQYCYFSNRLPLGKFLDTLPALQSVRLSSVNGPWWDEDDMSESIQAAYAFRPHLVSLHMQPYLVYHMGITRRHSEAFRHLRILRIEMDSMANIPCRCFKQLSYDN